MSYRFWAWCFILVSILAGPSYFDSVFECLGQREVAISGELIQLALRIEDFLIAWFRGEKFVCC